MKVSLKLEDLGVEGFEVQRSGIRWLFEDGHRCRPGEVIAWCNIGLMRRTNHVGTGGPLHEEHRDFQVALAPRLGGRLVKARGASEGGFLDMIQEQHVWSEGTVIGHLECTPGDIEGNPEDAGNLRMLMLAGRRVTECAEVRWGPSTGWHDRVRAWWADGDGDFGTVLSLGICELLGIVRGERGSFSELFAMVPGPAHVVYVPDDFLVPSSSVLCSQLQRTPADCAGIADDLAGTFGAAFAAESRAGRAVIRDWIFVGGLAQSLTRSPILDQYEVLTRGGIRRLGPPNALILSLRSEQTHLLCHRRLGYVLGCHSFRLQEAGSAVARWVRAEFELITRTPEDVKRDCLRLIDSVSALTKAHILFLNGVSSTGLEDVYCYAPFDRPLRDTLACISAKERNLMLYQLARERDISIVDVDAIAARLGVAKHVPDGAHHSGRLQKAVRARIAAILRERGVAGFGGAAGAPSAVDEIPSNFVDLIGPG